MGRRGYLPAFATLLFISTAMTFSAKGATAAGHPGGGFHGGGGGFHASAGGFHGGRFGGGSFHAAPRSNSFSAGHSFSAPHTFSAPHAYSAPHMYSVPHNFSAPPTYANHVGAAPWHSGIATAPRYNDNRETFSAPHWSSNAATAPNAFARTTPPHGNVGGWNHAPSGHTAWSHDHIGGGHNEAWRHDLSDHGHHHDFDHAHHGAVFRHFGFGFVPFVYYGYPSYYSAYDYSVYPQDNYYNDYYPQENGYYPQDNGAAEEAPYAGELASPPPAAGGETGESVTMGEQGQYYDEAVAAFRRGDYREAGRLASHALIDTPRDARIHELLSLALFALGDFRSAAVEAHAALALGPAADWPTLYGYYQNVDAYKSQLDVLGKYIREHPDAMDARFLAGYHDLMLGHTQQAEDMLAQVTAKEPKDKVVAALLEQLKTHAGTIGNIAARAQTVRRLKLLAVDRTPVGTIA
jgi:hypothetical protein